METQDVLSFDDADKLVKAFFRAHERAEPSAAGTPEPPALNPKGFGAAMVGEAEVFFEYNKEQRALECSALIYRFRSPPKPGIVEGFKAEAQSGTPTGGGSVDFEPENGGLFLSRTYADRVDSLTFVQEVDALSKASVDWAKQIVPRVASKVFRPQ